MLGFWFATPGDMDGSRSARTETRIADRVDPSDPSLVTELILGSCGVASRGCGPTEGPSSVDAINTFGVSAGRLAYFRVVSRSQVQRFRSSQPFLGRVRFPAAPLRKMQVRATSPGLIPFRSTPHGIGSMWPGWCRPKIP